MIEGCIDLQEYQDGWQDVVENGQVMVDFLKKNTIEPNKKLEDIKYLLEETIAEFLDQDNVIVHQAILGIKDPTPREETELHIRMAEAAIKEYEKSMSLTV